MPHFTDNKTIVPCQTIMVWPDLSIDIGVHMHLLVSHSLCAYSNIRAELILQGNASVYLLLVNDFISCSASKCTRQYLLKKNHILKGAAASEP